MASNERERQLRVRYRHDHGIHAAAAVARRQAQGRADQAAHDHGRHPDHEGYPGAEDHAREDVAAEVVGAEEMRAPVRALEGGRLESRAQRLTLRVLDDPRRDDRQDRQERYYAQAEPHEPGHAAALGRDA